LKVVVADTGVLISLGLIGKIELIENIFGELYIAEAVWNELCSYDNPDFSFAQFEKLKSKVMPIHTKNYLSVIMDYGESESVILYEELQADFLLIDDSKARTIAEALNINCIGTLGLLLKAKEKNLINELKPIFKKFLSNGRFFSKKLLNKILARTGEAEIK
jgi:predicted nucleic acid-binding protein